MSTRNQTSDFFLLCLLAAVVAAVTKHGCLHCAEPQKQFNLVTDHIMRIRRCAHWRLSKIVIYVERNLGHEAEHHRHALKDVPGVSFRIDGNRDRVGVLTTKDTKHAMATMLNVMLREQRLHVWQSPTIISMNPAMVMTRLKEQLHVYSYQYKSANDTFQEERVALSGKIGGMKDDVVIALQLGVYFVDLDQRNGIHVT